MIVYVDLIMLYDFFINYIIMYFIERTYTNKVKFLNIFFPSIISSIIVFLSLLNYYFLFLFKIFGGIIIYMFSGKCFSNREKLIKIMSYYFTNLAFIGLLKTFTINNFYLLLVALIIFIFIFIIQNNKKYYIFLTTCKYNVIVKNKGHTLKLDGFLDTGNMASYKGIPICFINEKYKDILASNNKINKVLVKTMNGVSIEDCIIPEYFVIEVNKIKRVKKVMICFTYLEEDCLLNNLII